MKKNNLLLIFLITFLSSQNLYSQNTPDCVVNPPVTAEMFEDTSSCLNGFGGLIFSFEDFQNLSNTTDTILGIPTTGMSDNEELDKDSYDNAVDLLAGAFGNSSLSDVYECLDIGCSPQMAFAQNQLDSMALLFGEGMSPEDIASLYEEFGDSTDWALDSLGTTSVDDFTSTLSDAMTGLDLDSLIADAFGAMESDCENSIWDQLLVDEEDPFDGNQGGAQFNEEMKKKMKEEMIKAVKMALTGESAEGGDPNWFLGEIEGLGMANPNAMMPSPSATSTIESINSGVNMYNGNASLGIPLDNIGSKDVSVPINVNSTPGGLKVNDQEGMLGSNMNLSAGGKITRVVRGLPDEFNGEIDAHAYGYRRGMKIVTEFYGINLGLNAPIENKWVKRIFCKLINLTLKKLLKVEFEGEGSVCNTSEQGGLLEQLLNSIEEDSTLNSDLVNSIAQPLNDTDLVQFLKKEFNLLNKEVGAVEFKISWKPLETNYISLRITGKLALGPAILTFGTTIRVGLKIVDVPSPIMVKKQGLGYNHLMNLEANDIEEFEGLDNLNVNEFFDLEPKDRIKYLTKVHASKKRDDKLFFDPKAFHFMNFFKNLKDVFDGGTLQEIIANIGDQLFEIPVYETVQLDLEPDEYYYDFGGYSGKFYFQPTGEITLVPYQDFKIEVDNREDGVLSFTFITPAGVKYTFDQQAKSKYTHYTLPTFFGYEEGKDEELFFSRTVFKSPEIGKVEYPGFKSILGIPFTREIKKDYLTNYYIEKAPVYTSAWHVSEVESLISKEKVNLFYKNAYLDYNSNKNWTHTFPAFAKQEDGKFKTERNTDLNLLGFATEWRNGFGDLTYSLSEAQVTEPYVTKIINNRGKEAEFIYKNNTSLIGSKLCDSIIINKNGEFYKGWKFGYTTPEHVEIEVSCTDTSMNTEPGQGEAFAEENEYYLKNNDPELDDDGDFVFYCPISIDLICFKFTIPLKFRFGTPNKDHEDYYYMNATRELTSLLHLKKYLNLLDDKEIGRYEGEFIRNFLFDITEINENDIITEFKYNGDLSSLPKRNSIHQDIWGYYNGTSSTMMPFIKETYEPIINSSVLPFNTDHFAFSHADGSNFSEGRKWKSDTSFIFIGQLDSVIMETGGFIKYNYDRHQYPMLASGIFSEQIYGGIRIKSLEKGSENGVTKKSIYEYLKPTVVNFPIFTDQHELDTYYKGYEEKVKTSWQPLNNWIPNKGGYVGYGQVNEIFEDNGRIVHIFSTPETEGYEPVAPKMEHMYFQYNRLFRWWSTGGNQLALENTEMDYHPTFASLMPREWRLGLELETRVVNESDMVLQHTTNEYTFIPMLNIHKGDTLGILKYPKTNMFQYNHYGSVNDYGKEGLLYRVVDNLTQCPENTLQHLLRFLFKQLTIEHPYRYIDKNFTQAEMIIESEKIEITQSESITYFEDGSNNSSNTVYQYYNDNERKLLNTIQTLSTDAEQKTTSTAYFYADNYMNSAGTYTFLEPSVLLELDQENNYEAPIHTISKVNNLIVGGSFTDLYQHADGRFLVESLWGYREGTLALTGRFLEYVDGMPTKYRLAKYGTGFIMNTYGYFPEITMTWDDNLLMTSRSMSGFTTSNTYNDLCQLVTSTDVNGLTTSYEYDGRRRLEVVTSPGELQKVTTEYVMNPLTITTITSFNDTTTLDQIQIQEMDGWGNPLANKRQPEDATLTTITYDHLWRPVKKFQLGSGIDTIIYEPSPLNRISQTIDAVGNVSQVEYLGPKIPDGVLDNIPANSEGYSFFAGTKTTDPNGHISYNWSDAFGKGTIRVSGAGGVTITKYDERERISKIFNPIGEVYEYEYNKFTGQLATKKIPGKAEEKFWYDESNRMVAKTDGDHHIILDYDDIYRLQDMHTGTGIPSQDPINGIPLAEESVNSLKDGLLLQNEYFAESTWMEKVTEGILKDGGVNGTKTMVYDLDDYGRVENVTSTYNTDQAYTVKEIFTPLTAAGLSPDVKKIVTSPNDENVLDYQYTFDKILRTTHTRLKLNDPSSPGVYKNIEQIVFNDFDQVEQKLIGATNIEDQYLQTVDYTYDDAGKLIAINDPLENGCVNEVEVCQLFWGSAASGINLEEEACGMVRGIILDGTLYEFPNVIHPSETEAIELLINTKLNELNLQGTAQVHYQSFAGISTDFHISIMKTDLTSAKIMFENATDTQCVFELTTQPESCCTIIAIGQDGSFPLPETYTNSPDLFFEQITYDGMDISLIEMAGSCTAGFIRNHYQYDADHRLKQVQNELFNPELIGDALSTAYSYDLAGNIMSLKRNGWVPEGAPGFTQIDNLTYTYKESTDPLLSGKHTSVLEKVEDIIDINAPNYSEYAQPHGFGKLSDVSEYTHDDLGRLIKDTGKGLTNISYNLLNLPETISINNGSIDHQYTFGGEKIKKSGAEGDRYYIGGIEYNENGLEFISIPNGRVLKGEQYQYNLTDHLGNVVVMFEDTNGDGLIQLEEETNGNPDLEPEVLQRNHYYSFGMRVESPGLINIGEAKNKYLYNGKELADDYGLNWHYYGFRNYDAAIGRFPSIDPIADNFAFVSGYNYAENNVPMSIDLWGLQKKVVENEHIGKVTHIQKRGEGENAAYDYSYELEEFGGRSFEKNGTSPSIEQLKLNNGHYLPQRFLDHYLKGEGQDYHLTSQEMEDVLPGVTGLGGSKNVDSRKVDRWKLRKLTEEMLPGDKKQLESYTVLGIAKNAGTLGSFTVEFRGLLEMKDDLIWEFNGEMRFKDGFNFNASDHRPWVAELQVAIARHYLRGKSFNIMSDWVPVRQTGFYGAVDWFYGKDNREIKSRDTKIATGN